ncbi:unnamed protein product [Protopolystoma xenopodis]|uniref:Uncharacterized protein n=1 Tax=Protopolystoma xenopodis TaxID=117903 RepID=A0A3S5CJB9_9PLAT|nr:unnamed protein product [Protopolystoma xenopodis]
MYIQEHKNVAVRRQCAVHVAAAAERLGAARLLHANNPTSTNSYGSGVSFAYGHATTNTCSGSVMGLSSWASMGALPTGSGGCANMSLAAAATNTTVTTASSSGSGTANMAERIIVAMAQFLMDSNQETR